MKTSRRFAAYPAAVAYRQPKSRAIGNAAQHLIWGDWAKLTGNQSGGWCEAFVRGVRGSVWIHEAELQEDRLLEVNYVDIGQGDGCLVITPEDKRIVVDAGEKDNMLRFLRWRFGGFNKKRHFQSFIVTHPDGDHYRGFSGLVQHKNVQVETLYHNGIVERPGQQRLGPIRKIGGIRYLEEIIQDRPALETFLASQAESRQPYTKLLRHAVTGGRVRDIRMLSAEDRYLPGYGRDRDLTVEVLAPVPERGGKLRWFGNPGKTKNGHSIVLRLLYGHLSILLGGDLNIPAENYLLSHYTGIDPEKASAGELQALLTSARRIFQCDVAKACHHGSSDFSTNFIRAVNPIATVISSGDNESYAHPRPDALGSLGRYGRGIRPLIFSTELARSGREIVKDPYQLRGEIKRHLNALLAEGRARDREKAKGKLAKLIEQLTQRSVAVYGMISLRTDGERVVLAQRLERPRNNASKWDIHCLESGPYGLAYQSKYITGGKRMRDIAKSIFLDGLKCKTRAWYARRFPGCPPTESERFRLEQGIEVGDLAKKLYPEGVEVQSRQLDRAAAVTQRLLADRQVTALFESAFRDGDTVARADILVRIRNGWKLVEVKSSKPPGTKEKRKLAELVDDIAYTTAVAVRAGVPVKKMSLLLISPRYRQSIAVDKLFRELDVTARVRDRLAEYEVIWSDIVKTSGQKKRPRPLLNPACKGCDFFSDRCLGLDVAYPVTELPYITRSSQKMAALGKLKRPSIKLVPAAFKLTKAQCRVRDAVLKGEPIVSKSLAARLAEIIWPAYYLDFESMATAIPLYPDIAPWEQILTQYSIHKCSKPGKEVSHKAYLADFDRDCRLELLKKLLRDLGTRGSIIVYSNFEELRINDLKKMFPRYADRLDALVERIFDLHAVIKDGYYDPRFHGRTSIKKVLPALVPRMSYQSLAIQNGDEAISVFARAALNQYTDKQKEQARRDLLAYCQQDTWAMVKLHERLVKIV